MLALAGRIVASGPPRSGLIAALICVGLPAHAAIEIVGIDGAPLENALAYMGSNEIDCEQDQIYAERVVRVAQDNVAEALRALGYYDAVVTTTLERADECWSATIDVVAGEPVRFRNVDIRVTGPAAEDLSFQAVRVPEELQPGAILHHGIYEDLKRRYLDLGRARGYAEARLVESKIDVYPNEHAADVSLVFDSGPRYSVGEVELIHDELAQSLVDAYVEIEPGQPFDNALLQKAYTDLNDSGYFAVVDVRAMPADRETKTIPVRIELTAIERLRISYGVGFSTDTGPRLRAGRTIRRFNERGHKLSVEGQLSPVVSEVTAIYQMPYGDPRYQWISFNVGAKREDTDTSSARSIEAGVRRVINRRASWSQTQSLRFAIEDFEVGTQKGRSRLLIPGIAWTRLRGDDALRPTNGSKYTFELRGASDAVLSDTTFVQAIADAKWIRSLSERIRVILRGTLGTTSTNKFENLPPSIRFFAGGDQSVRGYDFQQLGPVDENGDVIGGPRLAVVSVEFERTVKPRWSVAAFVDSGNAFKGTDIDPRTGAGLGARWRSPVGPVRIDIAWPVNDVDNGARLHITLGPDL